MMTRPSVTTRQTRYGARMTFDKEQLCCAVGCFEVAQYRAHWRDDPYTIWPYCPYHLKMDERLLATYWPDWHERGVPPPIVPDPTITGRSPQGLSLRALTWRDWVLLIVAGLAILALLLVIPLRL